MGMHDGHDYHVGDKVRLKNSRLFGKVVEVTCGNSLSSSTITVQWDGSKGRVPFKGDQIRKLIKP